MTPNDKQALQTALEACTTSPSGMVAAIAQVLVARMGVARALGVAHALALAVSPPHNPTGDPDFDNAKFREFVKNNHLTQAGMRGKYKSIT